MAQPTSNIVKKKYKYSYRIGNRTVKGYLDAFDKENAEDKLTILINLHELHGTEQFINVIDLQLTEVVEKIEPKQLEFELTLRHILIGIVLGTILAILTIIAEAYISTR